MAQYVGTGRHLSRTELQLWTSFLDASRIIESELAQHLAQDFAMSHREYEVLVRLDGAGGRMRLATLARQIEASRALVTQTVDRLGSRGWVERENAPDDGRGVDAVLTELGRSELAAAAAPHAALMRQLLIAPMDAGAIEIVATNLGVVADHLRSHRQGSGCGDPQCPVTQ